MAFTQRNARFKIPFAVPYSMGLIDKAAATEQPSSSYSRYLFLAFSLFDQLMATAIDLPVTFVGFVYESILMVSFRSDYLPKFCFQLEEHRVFDLA